MSNHRDDIVQARRVSTGEAPRVAAIQAAHEGQEGQAGQEEA